MPARSGGGGESLPSAGRRGGEGGRTDWRAGGWLAGAAGSEPSTRGGERPGRERGSARGRAPLRSPRARAGGREGERGGAGARRGAAVALGPGSCGHQSTVAIAAFDVIVRVVPLLPGLVIGGNPVSAEPL